jgi:ATP-binding cassette subfamily F protein uup
MLQPSDLLLLDEPTNDLDIPTLEILEESLMEYAGALALVTHDRYLLDRVSTVVLGLDGRGGMEVFADYSQWEEVATKAADNARTETAFAKSAQRRSAEEKVVVYGDSRIAEHRAAHYRCRRSTADCNGRRRKTRQSQVTDRN